MVVGGVLIYHVTIAFLGERLFPLSNDVESSSLIVNEDILSVSRNQTNSKSSSSEAMCVDEELISESVPGSYIFPY